jgi:hypothetical protein
VGTAQNNQPATLPAPSGLATLTNIADPRTFPALAPSGHAFRSAISDTGRLFLWSALGVDRYNVIADLSTPLQAATALSPGNLPGMTYVLGADSTGALHEWIAGSSHVRELRIQQLPYAVTALAVDVWGTELLAAQARASDAGVPQLETGPIAVYVGGPGNVERRVLTSLRMPLW